MSLRYVWLVIALVVLLGVASVFTLLTGKPAGNPDAFRLSADVDRPQYRLGETVKIAGKACSDQHAATVCHQGTYRIEAKWHVSRWMERR